MNSPIPEESEENVQYIIVDPRSLSDDESGSSKKRPRWEHWETKALISVMKDQNNKHKPQAKENFFLLEQEMKKRGVERWDSNQIQQKWRNMRKEWLNSRARGHCSNGTSRMMTEFQDELDELLGAHPSNYTLAGIDTTSGEEILGFEVETLEPTDHVDVIDDDDGTSQVFHVHCPEENVQHDVKPSTSSEDGHDLDSAHEQPFKAKKLKMRDASKGKGSYSAALAAFAANISERQENLVRTMLEEARKTAAEEAKRQQQYERELMIEHTTLLTTQLRKVISDNTRATLQGIRLLMELSQQMGIANMQCVENEAGKATAFQPSHLGDFESIPEPLMPGLVPSPHETSTASDLQHNPESVFKPAIATTGGSTPPLPSVLDESDTFSETAD